MIQEKEAALPRSFGLVIATPSTAEITTQSTCRRSEKNKEYNSTY